jgi:ATP-binding cassette subfamily F protein uup
VLEESLLEFPGALVLVTHDRYMLDRISTSVLGLDGEGGWGLFADYSQWEQARSRAKQTRAPAGPKTEPAAAPPVQPKKKRSYIEQREYDKIEDRIHGSEAALAEAQRDLQESSTMADAGRLQDAYARMQAAQAQVDELYRRWAELEEKLSD